MEVNITSVSELMSFLNNSCEFFNGNDGEDCTYDGAYIDSSKEKSILKIAIVPKREE
jgi:hypothetical protein